MRQCSRVSLRIFLSTPSARRATYAKVWNEWFRDISIHALLMQTGVKRVISIHALREEGDLPLGRNETARKISIHALREEGDVREDSQRRKDRNFYPRPPRGGRPSAFPPGRPGCRISIHALREEGDGFLAKMQTSRPYFYPRPPRGGRPYAGTPYHLFGRFLSTPSARRATEGDFLFIGWGCNFYPRPPRGGRPCSATLLLPGMDFYPRPPRGGRPFDLRDAVNGFVFLSTPSARRATQPSRSQTQRTSYFYPRPPRGGRRARLRARACMSIYFYPRPPRGGRQQQKQRRLKSEQFLSTPSARRATSGMIYSPRSSKFLSTPSARRATAATISEITPTTDFYPRPPRGGRRDQLFTLDGVFNISIHALREEGDSKNRDKISIFL